MKAGREAERSARRAIVAQQESSGSPTPPGPGASAGVASVGRADRSRLAESASAVCRLSSFPSSVSCYGSARDSYHPRRLGHQPRLARTRRARRGRDRPGQDAFSRPSAAEYPSGKLSASGEDVGLPAGQMGNSEVGHLNLGAGRIVYQDLTRISKAIADGKLAPNPVLQEAFAKAARPAGGCISWGWSATAASTAIGSPRSRWRSWPATPG